MNKSSENTHIYLDYYPFGMRMYDRSSNSSDYRYGFNGKESDDEVKGEGAQYDYGFRIYDPRIAKFLSVDPLANSFSWLTPYQYAQNDPIRNIDIDGLEGGSAIEYWITGIGQQLEAWWSSWSLFPKELPNAPAPPIKGDETKTEIKKVDEKQIEKKSTKTVLIEEKAKISTAEKIIDTKNVDFATLHSSRVVDEANAQANINDAAKGDKMKTSDYAHPKGAQVSLNDNAADAFLSLAKKYKMKVSEIAGGKHGKNSLHYQGKAFDITHINGVYMNKESEESKSFLKDAKKAGFIAVPEYENNHIHLQWGSNKTPKK